MNKLENKDAFEAVLANYQMSEQAKQLLARTPLVLLVGPSSSGKNTIINELLKTGRYHAIVSDTTRAPRENNGVMEQDGREYWFRPETELLDDLKNGRFLEAAIIHGQQVSGINIRELATASQDGKVAINEVDVVGAGHINAAKPDTLTLFVLPPSFDEWLVRMNIRGQLPDDEVRRRLTSAVNEIQAALAADYYHFVVNDTFRRTTERIDNIVQSEQMNEDDQARGRTIAQQILNDTQAYLTA